MRLGAEWLNFVLFLFIAALINDARIVYFQREWIVSESERAMIRETVKVLVLAPRGGKLAIPMCFVVSL